MIFIVNEIKIYNFCKVNTQTNYSKTHTELIELCFLKINTINE